MALFCNSPAREHQMGYDRSCDCGESRWQDIRSRRSPYSFNRRFGEQRGCESRPDFRGFWGDRDISRYNCQRDRGFHQFEDMGYPSDRFDDFWGPWDARSRLGPIRSFNTPHLPGAGGDRFGRFGLHGRGRHHPYGFGGFPTNMREGFTMPPPFLLRGYPMNPFGLNDHPGCARNNDNDKSNDADKSKEPTPNENEEMNEQSNTAPCQNCDRFGRMGWRMFEPPCVMHGFSRNVDGFSSSFGRKCDNCRGKDMNQNKEAQQNESSTTGCDSQKQSSTGNSKKSS